MFELAVSCIDTENVPENNTVYLSKEELFSFFEVGSNSKHTQFKEAIEIMQNKPILKSSLIKTRYWVWKHCPYPLC